MLPACRLHFVKICRSASKVEQTWINACDCMCFRLMLKLIFDNFLKILTKSDPYVRCYSRLNYVNNVLTA